MIYIKILSQHLVSRQIPQLNIKELIKKRNYEKVFEDEKNLIRVSLPFDTQRGVLFNYCNINGYMPIVLDDYFSFVHKNLDVFLMYSR